MANFGSILKNLRLSRNITQGELAAKLGISRSAVGMYETGGREPDFEMMEAIADIFNVDMDYLMGRSQVERKHPITPPNSEIPPGFQPMPEMDIVPLVGRIACGTPITAEENIERMVCVPSKWHATFTLTCEGTSMEPRIHDGDLVAIRSQPTVENGEVAAVRIDGEATLKRVYLHQGFIELRAENPAFESIILAKEEMNTVTIEGKAVGLCRDI
jgi:repressor LexA